MSTGTVDLADVVGRLVNRVPTRSEATVQSDLRLLLLAAGLNLLEENLEPGAFHPPLPPATDLDGDQRAVTDQRVHLRVADVELVGDLLQGQEPRGSGPGRRASGTQL